MCRLTAVTSLNVQTQPNMNVEPASTASPAPLIDSLIELLQELHAYYNDGNTTPRDCVREHLLDNLLGPHSPHQLIVAHAGDHRVIGLAAISLVYSLVDPAVETRRQCLLKELYVRASSRSQGAGRALMVWVAAHAHAQGCGRIDWPVRASNARGIAFYESLGAQRVVERLSYRLGGPALAQLAASHSVAEPT